MLCCVVLCWGKGWWCCAPCVCSVLYGLGGSECNDVCGHPAVRLSAWDPSGTAPVMRFDAKLTCVCLVRCLPSCTQSQGRHG